MPTMGLPAIRLPSGTATEELHETTSMPSSPGPCVPRSTVKRNSSLGVATSSSRCLCGVVTLCTASRMRLCRRFTDEPIMIKFGLLRHA